MEISVLLFNDFETLDVFGPVEIFGRRNNHYSIKFYSMEGGQITNNHGVSVFTLPINQLLAHDVFLIPGGYGTRIEVDNLVLINKIKEISTLAKFVLTVCTGTALLAKTGLLDFKNATTNKRAFEWVVSTGKNVIWNKKARWVVDGKFYTSSGVSAGMDMALGFLSDLHGKDFARNIAFEIEFNWSEDSTLDSFAIG